MWWAGEKAVSMVANWVGRKVGWWVECLVSTRAAKKDGLMAEKRVVPKAVW